jgi:hypothetical protein
VLLEGLGQLTNPVTYELLGFGLFPLSGILENRKHDVSETGSGVGREKTPTQSLFLRSPTE